MIPSCRMLKETLFKFDLHYIAFYCIILELENI